jgi:hypothetical protein
MAYSKNHFSNKIVHPDKFEIWAPSFGKLPNYLQIYLLELLYYGPDLW